VGDAVALGNIFGAPIEEVTFARDSPLEEAGFELWVPGEGTPTHASVTYDRYRRLSPAVRHLRPLTVAVAIRADTVLGGIRYIANLQCLRLSHYAVSNKTRIMIEYRERR
jgi:hypothetical protein